MGGEWRIRQHPPAGSDGDYRGYRMDVIPIKGGARGKTEPDVRMEDTCVTFIYPDGRIVLYPWASIVRAEYVPDPPDDQ